MIKHLQPYLIFPGTCEVALAYYAECFGGETVLLERYADSHLTVPHEHEGRVFNAAFHADGLHFMASDDLPGAGVEPGSNIALFVSFASEAEWSETFTTLSSDGRVLFPPADGFAMIEDRFGIRWMLTHPGHPPAMPADEAIPSHT